MMTARFIADYFTVDVNDDMSHVITFTQDYPADIKERVTQTIETVFAETPWPVIRRDGYYMRRLSELFTANEIVYAGGAEKETRGLAY